MDSIITLNERYWIIYRNSCDEDCHYVRYRMGVANHQPTLFTAYLEAALMNQRRLNPLVYRAIDAVV